jgi:hypothetical protein
MQKLITLSLLGTVCIRYHGSENMFEVSVGSPYENNQYKNVRYSKADSIEKAVDVLYDDVCKDLFGGTIE